MTILQQAVIIGLCSLATVLTRALPFLIFSADHPAPGFIRYLGRALPGAIFGMLVVYCLKNVDVLSGAHGLPEAVAILATVALHRWKGNMLLSIAGGTACYMLLIQFVF